MREFIKIYRLVKMVGIAEKALSPAEEASENQLVGFQGINIVTMSIRRDYRAKYKKMTAAGMNRLIADAINKQYLNSGTINHAGRNVDVVWLNHNGRKLLDKPLGTLDEFFKEYSSAISFLTGGFFVAVLVLLWHIISSIH